MALKYIVFLWDISRYPKKLNKGGPQYVVSAIFLEKISEGKIRGASPPLSANTKRFDSAYVAGGSAGLQTVDIRNPDSPQEHRFS